MKKETKFSIGYVLIALFIVLLFQDYWARRNQVIKLPYSEFQIFLKENKVKEIVIKNETIRGKFIDKEGKDRFFFTIMVEPDFAKELDQYGVTFSREFENTFFRDLLSWVLPVIFFIFLWMFIINKMASKGGIGGSLMSVGKSKAKIYVESDTKVTFKDVAGADEAKLELKEIIDFLTDPKGYARLGGKMPKGILLIGPPGTGKTLLARAVAGEANVPFFSTNGSEFVEMFVGVGAARVRDLFDQAKGKAPCIIFIDELDALGKARSIGPMGTNDEKEQTLNQLLVELDGFDPSSGIVLLAASNRPEILDSALLRAGRFDRQVLVDKPEKKGRLQILELHSKNVSLGKDVDLEKIAAITPGFTGADLANLVNEAALIATRRSAENVEQEDFNEAVERILAGLEKKNRVLNEFERKVVANHEMGHAIVGHLLTSSEPVHKVSIIPRGVGALGYTIQRPTEDRFLMTKKELVNKMAVLLGGRAAEKIIFDHISTGAADDIAKVTNIARSIVMRYGMSEKLGNITYDEEGQGFLQNQMPQFQARNFSEETAREIDLEVKNLVDESLKKALQTLETNRDTLTDSARVL